ncbi:hypothetical protein ACPUEK_02400 [Marinomonas gallaica]|uniref:hypothetical protein n=1 Tax=Marinomonas gallaica TaxID=1806667 RepID=UPI003CE4ACE1
MKQVLLFFAGIFFSSLVSAEQDPNSYFYDIIFLNDLSLAPEAVDQCHEYGPEPETAYAYACDIFAKLEGKKLGLVLNDDEKNSTLKVDESTYTSEFDEDFSLHYVDAYTRSGEHFEALIDTASYASFADVATNLSGTDTPLNENLSFFYKHVFGIESPYNKTLSVGVSLVDLHTDIAGMRNKILLTKTGIDGVLGVDFIGYYGQFSFYPDGIAIQPEEVHCKEKCVSYDAMFDGENLHFFYPMNGELQRVSFETGSPISTVPFSTEDSCVAKDVDFSELAERGLDISDESKLCKWSYEFGDYTMQSSVVTQASREIDGEPLPVMGMNMINAFDHVTVDLQAEKIYFYHH